MKKEELQTIVRKIQNRCYLENPTKITYYRNDDGDVVFKIFFDSLYVPEKFRVAEENLQNMFATANCYEYEDDFRIIALDQDEGFVKVIPDSQKFKIVNSYKDVNELESDKKVEESVILAGEKLGLNENFVKNKGFVLYEGEEVRASAETGTTSGVSADTIKAKTDALEKDTGKEKVKKDVYVLGLTCPVLKTADELYLEAINKINELNTGKNSTAVVLTIPNYDDSFPAFGLAALQNYNTQLQEAVGETYSYLAVDGNTYFLDYLKTLDIQNVYFVTDTAEKGLKDNNIPGLLNCPNVQAIEGIIHDSTAEDFKSKVQPKLTARVAAWEKKHKDLKLKKNDKRVAKARDFYEKNPEAMENVLSLLRSVYTEGEHQEFQDLIAQYGKKAYKLLKDAKNIGKANVKKAAVDEAKKNEESLFSSIASYTVGELLQRKAADFNTGEGMWKNGGGVTASNLGTKAKVKVNPIEKKNNKITASPMDAWLWMLTDFLEKWEQSMQDVKALLSDSVNLGAELKFPKEDDEADAENKEDQEKKQDEQKPEETDSSDEETQDDAAPEETEETGETEEAKVEEAFTKGSSYRRLVEIFKDVK